MVEELIAEGRTREEVVALLIEQFGMRSVDAELLVATALGEPGDVIVEQLPELVVDEAAEPRSQPSWYLGDSTRAWDESKHPRDPGGEGGGQWIPKGTSAEGASADPTAEMTPDEVVTHLSKMSKVSVGWYANADGTWGIIGDDPASVPTKTEVEASEQVGGIYTGMNTQREWAVAYDRNGGLRESYQAGDTMDWSDTMRDAKKYLPSRIKARDPRYKAAVERQQQQ